MKIHKSITIDRICDAVERQTFGLENPGFCIKCGEEREGCEPDAQKYPCENEECRARAVYGAEELLLHVQG